MGRSTRSRLILAFLVVGTLCLAHPSTLSYLMMMSDWQTVGSATPTVIECDSCFTLTTETPGQTGCVWDHIPRDLAVGIDLSFTMNFGDNDDNGADGMTMVISTTPDQCAGTGSSIGAMNFVEALIVEFDTWRNPEIGDPLCDHIAIFLNSDQDYPLFGPECVGSFPIFDNFEDGEFHDITFTYDPETGDIVVTFDGETVIDENFDLEGFLGSTEYYLGFTASTGGSVNEQIVCPGIPVMPPEAPVIDQSTLEVCAGDMGVIYSVLPIDETLEWSAPSGASITVVDATSIAVDFGDTSGDVCVWAVGCENSDTVCVAVDVVPVPDVNVEPVPVVCGTEYSLTDLVLLGIDGTETITFHLTEADAQAGDNALTDLIIEGDALIYIRIVSSTGCALILSVDIVFGTLDVSFNPDPVPPLCVGSTFDLSTLSYLDANGNVILGISYYATEADAMAEQNEISSLVNVAGSYYVRLISADGCTDIIEIIITAAALPELEIMPDSIGCNDPTVTITHTGSDFWAYTWSRPGGTIISTEQFPTVSDTGTYLVEFMDGNGCSDTASVYIAAASDLPLTTISADTLSCRVTTGQFILDTIIVGYMYQWSGPGDYSESVAEPSYDTAGNYRLLITAPGGCTAELEVEIIADVDLPQSAYSIVDSSTCAFPVVRPVVDTVYADATYSWTGPGAYMDSTALPDLPESGDYELTITASNGCSWDTTLTVHPDTIAPSSTLAANILTCAEDSTTISLASDGDSFEWSGPGDFADSSMSPTVGQAGWYIVTITAVNGCTTTDSILVVAERDDPVIDSIEFDTLTCLVTETLLDVSPRENNYDISWSQEGSVISTEEDLSVSDSGTYVLTVMAANGCTIMREVTVVKNEEEPIINLAIDTISCSRPTASLQVLPVGVYDIEWQGPESYNETGDSVSTTRGGAYTVLATDRTNGCTEERFFTVVLDTLSPTVMIRDVGAFSCDTDSLQIFADTTGRIVAIEWSGPSGYISSALNPFVYRPGDYTIQVTGANGCMATGIVTVGQDADLPSVTLSSDTITCHMTQATVRASGAETDWIIVWTLPDGSTTTGAEILSSLPGVHMIDVTDPSTGCMFSDRIAVAIDTISPSPIITVMGALSCSETEVNLSVTASTEVADEILWSGPDGYSASDPEITVMQSGEYTVTVISARNGCSSTRSALIERSDDGITDADLSTIPADCTSGLGSLRVTAVSGGSAPYTYEVMGNSSADGIFTGLPPGDYQLAVTDAEGCTYTENFIIDPSEQITVDGITLLTLETGEGELLEYATTTPAAAVLWTPPLAGCDSCLTIPVTSADAGTYQLIVTSALGCTDLLTLTITVNQPDVYIPNVFTPANRDGVNDIFTVQASDVTGRYSMSIYDRWGNRVYRSENAELNDPTAGWNGQIQGQLAMSGVYIYVVQVEIDGSDIARVISGDLTLLY